MLLQRGLRLDAEIHALGDCGAGDDTLGQHPILRRLHDERLGTVGVHGGGDADVPLGDCARCAGRHREVQQADDAAVAADHRRAGGQLTDDAGFGPGAAFPVPARFLEDQLAGGAVGHGSGVLLAVDSYGLPVYVCQLLLR